MISKGRGSPLRTLPLLTGVCMIILFAVTIASLTTLKGGPNSSFLGERNAAVTTTGSGSVAVKCAPSPVSYGSSTQCTATVGGTSPTGQVTWSTDAGGAFNPVSCNLVSGSCGAAFSPASAQSPVLVRAAYAGDSKNSPKSGNFSLAVDPAHTSTTVTCSPSTTDVGGNSTCSATVVGQSPTGTISWRGNNGGTFNPDSCNLVKGKCNSVYTQATVSLTTITASYSGDSNNGGSSGGFSLTVAKAQSSTALTCFPSTILQGSTTSCVATVAGYSPTGTVSLSTSGNVGSFIPASGQCALFSGNCTIGYRSGTYGTLVITGSYGGDSDNRPSSAKFSVVSIQATVFNINASDPSVGTTCSGLLGVWDGVAKACTLNGATTFGPSYYVLIRPGASLILSGTASLVDQGTINNTGGILTVYGTLSIASSGRLANSIYQGACGKASNIGTVTNSGTIVNSCAFISIDLIKNEAGGVIDATGGSISNKGTISNSAGGSIVDDSGTQAAINNTGTISNSGTLDLFGGDTVYVTDASGFSGSFINGGTLNMNSGSSLVVGKGSAQTVLEVKAGIFLVGSGVTLTISPGSEVLVDTGSSVRSVGRVITQSGSGGSGGSIAINGQFANGPTGLLTNNGGCSIVNNQGGTLVSNGTVTNKGIVWNYGALSNGAGASFTNSGTINNKGSIANAGSLSNNAGVITNNLGGTLANLRSGVITNNVFGTIDNNSGGTITNSGQIAIVGGTLINNSGGTITNNADGTLNNKAGGTIDNNPGGSFSSSGSVVNSGAFTSNGIVTNLGTFANGGDVTNSGTIVNNGTLSSTGTVTSSGSIINGGAFENQGSVVVSGGFTNQSPGTFENDGNLISSGRISTWGAFVNGLNGRITNRGQFSNQGVFYNCGGVSGSSSTSGNAPIICYVAQATQGVVSAGSVQTLSFTATGIGVSISGTYGTLAGVAGALEAGQPVGTPPIGLSSMGNTPPQFFDLSVFGLNGGIAHICIPIQSADPRTVIEYYYGGSWIQADSIAVKGGKVCGDVPVSGLSGTPLAVGDSSSTVTTSSTTSSTTRTPRTTTSMSESSVSSASSTTSESQTSTLPSETSSQPPESTSQTGSFVLTSKGSGGSIPEFPGQLWEAAVVSLLVVTAYSLARRRR